jgi:hypothetical protein
MVSYGKGIVITTRGPGKVHLLSYANNSGTSPHKAITTTSRKGTTRFVISHTFNFTKFAFYWDGASQASCTTGEDTGTVPVGTGWNAATCVTWNSYSFTTENVSSDVSRALDRNNLITCFILPDDHTLTADSELVKPLSTGIYSIRNVRQLKALSLNDSFDGTPIVGDAVDATVTENSKVCIILSFSIFSPLITKHGSSGTLLNSEMEDSIYRVLAASIMPTLGIAPALEMLWKGGVLPTNG